ncbi:UNVERIFIED_CONTAM: hypothetical protein K2H54_018476 [Gekko kuhli]
MTDEKASQEAEGKDQTARERTGYPTWETVLGDLATCRPSLHQLYGSKGEDPISSHTKKKTVNVVIRVEDKEEWSLESNPVSEDLNPTAEDCTPKFIAEGDYGASKPL